MTDEVWRQLPVEIRPTLEELPEIKITPPEPDERVTTVEEENARMEEAAREQALAFFLNTATGVYLPLPDLTGWPERYRKAFEDELARLRERR